MRIGIDLVEVEKIQKMFEKTGDAFLKTVFTTEELAYCQNKKAFFRHLAGRFAVKEAVLKTAGTGKTPVIDWMDIEVINDRNGRPSVRLKGNIKEIFEEQGISRFDISISHTKSLAVAQAIAC